VEARVPIVATFSVLVRSPPQQKILAPPHDESVQMSKTFPPLRLPSAVLVLACGWVACGCSRTETSERSVPEAQTTSLREYSPELFLKAVLTRYQNASSYHDRGHVRLRYQDEGQWTSQAAPIQVWLDHDQLYVAAYDARIWRDDQALTCWIMDPATNDFDSQVVRRPATRDRPTLQQLLADPILSSHMAAGLAGPPPQLEWLFAPEPMEPLFDGTHQFKFAEPQSIDETPCQRVVVDDTYVFWIDQTNSTIRRVELPQLNAPVTPGAPRQSMSLTIELVGATFRADRETLKISPLPPQPKYVGNFVPRPPPKPSETLGARAPAFQLPADGKNWAVSENGSDRELTLMVAFKGDADSVYTSRSIEHWQANMPADLRRRLRIALLVDRESAALIPPGNSLAVVMDEDRRITNALGIGAGGVVILNQQGIVSWTQPHWTATGSQPLVTLGAVIADLLSGVNVPERIRQQWKEEKAAYAKALGR